MANSSYGLIGPTIGSDNTVQQIRMCKQGSQINSNLHALCYEQTYRGNVFSLSVTSAAAITAYTGGAGGTPQIAVYNPAGSGRNAVMLFANYANVVAASAAGTVAWGIYFGQTAAITQATTTAPTSMVTLATGGSVMTGFRNVALTSGTAAAGVLAVGSYYWATAAAAALVSQPSEIELQGKLIIPPGAYCALGGSAALTSATWIGHLIWEEVPI